MKKYFILTNYSEFYNNKMVLLKAASSEGANAYINRTIDKIVRESVLEGLEVTDVTRDDNESSVIISDYDLRGVQHAREYKFSILEVDTITDFDKWFIFSNEIDEDSCYIESEVHNDFRGACERLVELVDEAADIFDCKSVINWTLRTASAGDNEKFVLMSVQEMLEIK